METQPFGLLELVEDPSAVDPEDQDGTAERSTPRNGDGRAHLI